MDDDSSEMEPMEKVSLKELGETDSGEPGPGGIPDVVYCIFRISRKNYECCL